MQGIGEEHMRRARRLHDQAIVIDTHCDTTQRLMGEGWDFSERHDDGHVDIPRLREGGVGAIFLAVYAPAPTEPGAAAATARGQIERIHETVRRWDRVLTLARTAEDIRRAKSDGKIAILIGIEGGHLIEDSLDVLREFHGRGAAYLTLTHAFHTNWADSSGVHEELPSLYGGLTDFGREVVRELNRLGMMVDVSHVSDETFWNVVESSSAPIVATHSSCRAVSLHRRNLSDEMIEAIAKGGGVVQINFHAGFVDPNFPPIDPQAVRDWWESAAAHRRPLTDHRTPLSVLIDHFDHALRLVGPDHVGIGSDFDGVPALPAGMEDCSKLPNLTAALLGRGYSQADLTKVLGGNVLRVMEDCHRVACRLRGGSSPLTQPSPPEGERACQSLTFALRTIARNAGFEIDPDDLNAALGLSWLVCAVPNEPDVGLWSRYARDAFLVEAGRLFGMQIREIHPPEAARGLGAAAEFDQHFDASYRPLIQRALEHGQPVLAWQGWPDERSLSWGVIRESCDEGVGFRGMTIGSEADLASPRLFTLTRPPIQLYVVERITPRAPDAVELLSVALDHARVVLGNERNNRFGVITGPPAIDEWTAQLSTSIRAASGSKRKIRTATVRERTEQKLEVQSSKLKEGESLREGKPEQTFGTSDFELRSSSPGSVAASPGSERNAASVIAGCESMIRFLLKYGPAMSTNQSMIAQALVTEAKTISGTLREFSRIVETGPPDAPTMLVDRLSQVRAATVRAEVALRSLASLHRGAPRIARQVPAP